MCRSTQVWESVHVQLPHVIRSQRIQANRRRRPHPNYQQDQKVWLSTRDFKLHLPYRKLSPKYIGPFRILRQINPVTYQLVASCYDHCSHLSRFQFLARVLVLFARFSVFPCTDPLPDYVSDLRFGLSALINLLFWIMNSFHAHSEGVSHKRFYLH